MNKQTDIHIDRDKHATEQLEINLQPVNQTDNQARRQTGTQTDMQTNR